jgi:hypothetical protein
MNGFVIAWLHSFRGLLMNRFEIQIVINDTFHIFADNEAEAKIEALRRIRVGAWPFDHSVNPQDFTIKAIKRG